MASIEARVKHMEDYMKRGLHYKPLTGEASRPAASRQTKPSAGRSSRSRAKKRGGKKK